MTRTSEPDRRSRRVCRGCKRRRGAKAFGVLPNGEPNMFCPDCVQKARRRMARARELRGGCDA